MMISLSIPDQLGGVLQAAYGQNLDRAVREAVALEGYRSRKFGTGVVAQLLELPDRWSAEHWLGTHGVVRQYNLDDLDADRDTLGALLGHAPSPS